VKVWAFVMALSMWQAEASTADRYKAEYISGHVGFAKKIKGEIAVGAESLIFQSDDKKDTFTIAMSSVTKASNAIENNTGGMGRKLVFGNLSNRSEGFVYVSTETPTAAEALVFKVDQKLPPGIVAKIEFAAKNARAKAIK
jgi:hypothetical protein